MTNERAIEILKAMAQANYMTGLTENATALVMGVNALEMKRTRT